MFEIRNNFQNLNFKIFKTGIQFWKSNHLKFEFVSNIRSSCFEYLISTIAPLLGAGR